MEWLEKGLIDLGLVFSDVNDPRYETLSVPTVDTWGVLMRKDSPLAEKDFITPEDLRDKPLLIPQQRADRPVIYRWLGIPRAEINEIVSYNLIYNASVLVDEGLGYALCFAGLINTEGTDMVFRPLSPAISSYGTVLWKKYQPLSKASE